MLIVCLMAQECTSTRAW